MQLDIQMKVQYSEFEGGDELTRRGMNNDVDRRQKLIIIGKEVMGTSAKNFWPILAYYIAAGGDLEVASF